MADPRHAWAPVRRLLGASNQPLYSKKPTRPVGLRPLTQATHAAGAETARLPDIRALANAFETNRGDVRAIAHELHGSGSSLGGARPKSDFEDRHGDLHIAKYTTEKDTLPVERVEAAVLTLAGEVGLRASSVELALAASPYPVALIKRFDRVGGRHARQLR